MCTNGLCTRWLAYHIHADTHTANADSPIHGDAIMHSVRHTTQSKHSSASALSSTGVRTIQKSIAIVLCSERARYRKKRNEILPLHVTQ